MLTPGVAATRMDVRGFHVKSAEGRERLETVGRTFLAGYAYAAEAKHPTDAEEPLERVPMGFRGFAYEGAAMALAVRDGLPLGGGRHVERFLAGRAADHVYMVYVGVGWAMARLPKFRWSTLYAPDPLLRWLVLDGFGFHQAYFATDRYVHDQHRDPAFPWPHDGRSYANNAIDQGIGRASWFVAGADPRVAAALIGKFAADRQPDLWAGVGLAACYAGGATGDELRRLWEAAGAHQPELMQGAAFAAAARVKANLVQPHNELASELLCGMSAASAAKVTDEARIDLPPDGDLPAFAVWRGRIADAFVAHRG
ncbi:enediyne biosynthesis protein [Asanoa siamensis]|uniref:Enediyne biosynthesis protein n=1 Tax=Asanoa siamensis TaxID=926357 RepID=A0ABQ4CLH0_9ACTN|nr:enediyne biosynthesis protein [Asanoa siamensis]